MAKQETVPARRGRPSNFPGQTTVPFLAKIPVETRDMVKTLAERREEPIGVTLDRMIRRAFTEANRSRKSEPSAS